MLVLSRKVRYVLARQPHLVGVARRVVTQRAGAWGAGLDEQATSTLRLLVSEIVTNAIQHTRTPFIGLHLSVAGRLLLVSVHDDSPVLPVLPDPGPDAWEREHGRGMLLVAALADRHGWRRTSRGKNVWFQLALPEACLPNDFSADSASGCSQRHPSLAAHSRSRTFWPGGRSCGRAETRPCRRANGGTSPTEGSAGSCPALPSSPLPGWLPW